MEEQEPQTQPTPPPTSTTPAETAPAGEPSHATAIILQWLSYNFWAWLSYGLIWLLADVLANSIAKSDVSSNVPYAVAISVVLGIVAIVTEIFYIRREPAGHKTGFAMVLMVIYAVGFSLVAIGSLVGALIAGLNLMIGDSGTNGLIVTMLVLLFSAILNGIFIMRVTGVFKTKSAAKIFAYSMLGLTVLLLVLTIAGPLTKSINDRNQTTLNSKY